MLEVTDLRVADAPGERIPRKPAQKASLLHRIVMLIAIVLPFAGIIAAPLFVWGWGFQWTDLALLVTMYVLTTLGITVGFHRLFVHRSFETFLWIKVIFAILGSMAVQGSLFQWVGMHRWHHQHSDTPLDPHTPYHHGKGVWGLLKGFWHSHIGWLFDADPAGLDRYIRDLAASRALRVTSRLFPLWLALGLLIPAIFGGLLTWSWQGVLTGFIWGGLVRVFLVHHVTWSVNSACHLWGKQPFRSKDMSRNNAFFGVLALGEGWHNAHHAFPTSARHGLRWWQIDVSYLLIRTLALLGLAWNVKVPTKETQAKERRVSSATENEMPAPPRSIRRTH